MTYDFFAPSTRDDPYSLFNRLRTNDPVFETDFGYWYVTRYDDVAKLLRDTRLIAGQGVPDSLGVREGTLRSVMDAWLMATDGAAHARTRRLISRAFTPRAVEALRAPVTRLADRLVSDLVAAGGGDIVTALAYPLPMEVVRLLFGVDAGRWEVEVAGVFDPSVPGSEGRFLDQLDQLTEFFDVLVGERRMARGDDVFSALFGADDDGETLSDLELKANAVLLVTAGFETTMSLITLAVRTLLLHRDQLQLLRRDHSLVHQAVDEVLRFEPAALSTTRHTTVDVEVNGRVIPAGQNVLFSLAAANRDPDRFDRPDEFDITRSDSRPLTFGAGVHNCIGATLAHMEAEIALIALIDGAPRLRLRDERCTWQQANPTIRRPTSLGVDA
jgi:pimeloyl-[acyl-carrier protein] synthase